MYENNELNYYNSENDGYRPNDMGQSFDTMPPAPSQQPTFKKKRGGAGRAIALMLCCAIVGTGAGMGGAALYMTQIAPETSATTTPTVAVASGSAASATTLVTSTSSGQLLTADELYATNITSCVGITISGTTTNVFGQVSTSAASGSGFVLTSDGYIVTNYHVIADAVDNNQMEIEVSFENGDSYAAVLVGYEADNDIALLKIDATNLQAVILGDSDQIVVGETVYAIGNPLGELTFSFTDGLISATDRLIATDEDTTMNMMQTNTAINPGNSGGPLFNEAGQVIGITTAKYTTSSSGTNVEGLGFAIPINDVIDILSDLMTYGYVTGKPYMGVQITSISAEAQYYGISAGAYVSYVAPGGAAEVAGLTTGDIITAIDDTVVDSSSALTAAITAYRAGDTALLTVIRDNQQMQVSITFDEKNTTTESANQIIVQEEETTQSQTPSNNSGDMSQDEFYRYFFGR